MTEIKTGAFKCPHTNGRLQTVYTDEVIIKAVEDLQDATPAKVAEKVGCHPTVARRKLKSLHERGLIYGNKLTGRWVFWI